MTDRELDVLVARKVLGKFIHESPSDKYFDDHIFLPHYSTDIRAAWEVVEKLSNLEKEIEIHYQSLTGEWEVRIEDYSPLEERNVPRAICLAALKAVGVNK